MWFSLVKSIDDILILSFSLFFAWQGGGVGDFSIHVYKSLVYWCKIK